MNIKKKIWIVVKFTEKSRDKAKKGTIILSNATC